MPKKKQTTQLQEGKEQLGGVKPPPKNTEVRPPPPQAQYDRSNMVMMYGVPEPPSIPVDLPDVDIFAHLRQQQEPVVPEEVITRTIEEVESTESHIVLKWKNHDEPALMVDPQELFGMIEKQGFTVEVIARGLVGFKCVLSRIEGTWIMTGILKED